VYTPRYFAESDLTQLDWLAQAYPFAIVITSAGDEPFVTHLPILYQREGDAISIRGHWSRANPQWKHGGGATLILQGPQTYISPSWYPDKLPEARVPTWNYVAAHLSGPLEIIEDEASLAAIVSDLTTRHEADVGGNWRFEFEEPDLRSQLRGIVGFVLRPAKIEMKFKLNQNHPAANIESVAGKLASGNENARAVSALMLENLSRKATRENP
jgi:transcriptional regulator